VTITGVGGAGKTRLAIAIGEEELVWLATITLAPRIDSSELLPVLTCCLT
jgi:predicted ATPase